MTPKTCTYFSASELFKDCPRAFTAFCYCDPECSWGDNNVSLITAGLIFDALEDDDDEYENTMNQIKTVKKRLVEIGMAAYIDLES